MSWQIDPLHTQVEFATKHFGMMTVRGHFTDVVSRLTFSEQDHAAASVEVTIAAASIQTHNAIRDNDLRSNHFLDVDHYPTIHFRSTAIEQVEPDRYNMTGDLTIKDVTRAVTLAVRYYGEINDPMMGHRMAFSAEGQINRQDWGLTTNMRVGDRLVVGDEIQISIEIEVVEQREEPAAT